MMRFIFQKDDAAVCTNGSPTLGLTLGRVYDVKDISDDCLGVVNDRGVEISASVGRFYPLDPSTIGRSAYELAVKTLAKSDAAFDGRIFDSLGAADRDRYLDRSRAGLALVGEIMASQSVVMAGMATTNAQKAVEQLPVMSGKPASSYEEGLHDGYARGLRDALRAVSSLNPSAKSAPVEDCQ